MSDEGTSEEKKERRKHLRLVSSSRPEGVPLAWSLRVLAELPDLSQRQYNRASWSDVLEARGDLLERRLVIRESSNESFEDKVKRASGAVLRLLEVCRAMIRVTEVNWPFITRLAEEADLHNSDPEVFHDRRIARKLSEAAQYLASLPNIRLSLEMLDLQLLRVGIRVTDTDVIRLLVYALNREHLVPRVLGLPNKRQPNNPSYVLLEGELALPAKTAEFLHLLNN